jgi:transcriptional regulator with XRE-family HTH domain
VDVKQQKPNDARIRRAFGGVLRRYREAGKLTQDALAERAECSQVYVSLLEQGKQSPSLVRLFDLADALGATPHEILISLEDELKLISNESHSAKEG